MDKLQGFALCSWLLFLTYLMRVEESIILSDFGPQTEIPTVHYDHHELCDDGVDTTLGPITSVTLITLTYAMKHASQYIVINIWLLRRRNFIWVKVTIVSFHLKLGLLTTLLQKITNALRGCLKVTVQDAGIVQTDVERRSNYKSIIALSSGCQPNHVQLSELQIRLKYITVGIPPIPDCKLSSLLQLVPQESRKSKYIKELLTTAPNSFATVPINFLEAILPSWLSPNPDYCVYVYYKEKKADIWIVNFVIAPNDLRCNQEVKDKFCNHVEAVPAFVVKFEEGEVILKIRRKRQHGYSTNEIPLEGMDLHCGTITPLTNQRILKEQVNKFGKGDGHAMPRCQFQVKWKAGDKLELKETLVLEGAKTPSNIFNLVLNYEARQQQSEEYSVYVFKKKLAPDHWIMSVAVVQDDPKCEAAVKRKFFGHDEAISPFPVKFEQNAIDLKIRKKEKLPLEIPLEGLDLDGWNITPDIYPRITKDRVKRFLGGNGGLVPCCQLHVKCLKVNSGNRIELKEVVFLEGAEKPLNVFVFNVMCSYEGYPSSFVGAGEDAIDFPVQKKKPKIWDLSKVIENTQADWWDLATRLHFEPYEVSAIASNNQTVRRMCQVMLGNWLEGQGKRTPRTWSTLLDALREIGRTELAEELVAQLL